MLFHSQEFLFVFLPVTVLGTYFARRLGNLPSIAWLFGCSLFFYGFGDFAQEGISGFNWGHVGLINFSIGFNFLIGRRIARDSQTSRRFLIYGIALNLGLLAFFKYTDLFASTLLGIAGRPFEGLGLELPLAISFFTFQQIAFLVDLNKGKMGLPLFRNYLLFVAFFPQLIAGPIVKCQKIVPQLKGGCLARIDKRLFWSGLCLFSIGIFKKAFLADEIRPIADAAFHVLSDGEVLSFAEAWAGATAFSFQIYFDFSAYSDIAIGLGLLFGLRLPINFNSPYKAVSIMDFWRRWHITLSEFLRDYLYIPLGGNRAGVRQGVVNVLIVMLLGGLWHGASWNFMVWGGLHGIFIVISHLLRRLGGRKPAGETSTWRRWISCAFTFALVTLAWTFFRSPDFGHSISMVKSMIGINGIDLPRSFGLGDWGPLRSQGLSPNMFLNLNLMPVLGLFGFLIWLAPNSQNLVGIDFTRQDISTPSMPSGKVIFMCGILLFFGLKSSFEIITYDYLYFRF
jgi:alginate O-acetyltransferase complex protein AlgI